MRLVAVSLPNIRDFQGIPKKFDGHGNYTLGVNDHTIFPEIKMEGVKVQTGMDICFVTTADNDEEGKELLELLGMPFRK
jgi:large subunit ribosomal protein L5